MKYFQLFFLLFIFYSCSVFDPYSLKNYNLNAPIKTFIGDEMIKVEHGYKGYDENEKYKTFVQQLIYSGIENKIIKIYYREFSANNRDEYIRDSYTLQLSYDVSESDTIRFRNILMKILNANSSEINFFVINDNDKITSVNTNIKKKLDDSIPTRIRPQDLEQTKCAKKFLKKDYDGWYIVESKEIYAKYVECRGY